MRTICNACNEAVCECNAPDPAQQGPSWAKPKRNGVPFEYPAESDWLRQSVRLAGYAAPSTGDHARRSPYTASYCDPSRWVSPPPELARAFSRWVFENAPDLSRIEEIAERIGVLPITVTALLCLERASQLEIDRVAEWMLGGREKVSPAR